MNPKKVLIFIVTYNAEKTIKKVLSRIPEEIRDSHNYKTEILIIDDSSRDNTFLEAIDYKNRHGLRNLKILLNPENLGYGGNQKVGYQYAIVNKFDIVVLLHGDGQYAPEELPVLLAPLIDDQVEAVFGSRMIDRMSAIKGGMPLYKYFGNKMLTSLQNLILGSRLSEFHSGYRLYKVSALSSVPFASNSNDFDFDTDIIIQFLQKRFRILELPIPTFYGDEICYVNGVKYAFNIIKSSIVSRLQHFGIFYHPKFDTFSENLVYEGKFGYESSHQIAYDFIEKDDHVLDLASGPGIVPEKISEKTPHITAVDAYMSHLAKKYSESYIQDDLNDFDFSRLDLNFDKILMLDIIEHLKDPEQFLQKLRDSLSHSPLILITTGNIGFFLNRILLLLGYFRYGKVGILDKTHTRLFTFSSLRHILKIYGFEIVSCRGIPAPFPKAIGLNSLSRLLLLINKLFIRVNKGLFSYQIAYIVKPLPSLNQLLDSAENKARVSAFK
jgi:glycosyltransferase involved in cell wall biosynthesis